MRIGDDDESDTLDLSSPFRTCLRANWDTHMITWYREQPPPSFRSAAGYTFFCFERTMYQCRYFHLLEDPGDTGIFM